MGKGILVAIAATTVLTIGVTMGLNRSALTSHETKVRDEQSLLAEEAARSGLEMTTSRLMREFDTWRTGLPVTPFGGGSFVTAVSGPVTGPLTAYSAGVVGGVDAQMTATVARLAVAPAALVVQSDSIDVTLSNDIASSGVDHMVGAGEGFGQGEAVYGVWASSAQARDAFTDELGMVRRSRIRGVTEQSDVHQGALPGEHAALMAEAVSRATHTYTSSQTFTSQQFGSEDSLAIVVVDGDATFTNGGGVGLLYVRGSFNASGDFSWRGLVIAEGDGDMTFSMQDDAEIVGAAYALHASSAGGGVSENAFIALQDVPSHDGFGTFTDIVAWPNGGGDVTVEYTHSGPAPIDHNGKFRGSSLQSFIGLANINGVDLKPGGITNVDYVGPTEMPMLDIRPANTSGGSTSDIRLQFSTMPPASPLYLYVADLDWSRLDITALNASGSPLSTVSWTKSLSVDLIVPDEGSRTTLVTNNNWAQIIPHTPGGGDAEVIIDEIKIPDPSQIASLRFKWDSGVNGSEFVGISVASESIFGRSGELALSLTDRSAIRYSTTEIGRLARPLTSIRARSEIVTYDYRTEMEVDRATVRQQTGTGRATAYPYCQDGTTHEAATLMDRLTKQLAGATAGACS